MTRISIGEDGRFRVGLAPGTWTLHPVSGDPLPRADDQTVRVEAGVWLEVVVSWDTSMR